MIIARVSAPSWEANTPWFPVLYFAYSRGVGDKYAGSAPGTKGISEKEATIARLEFNLHPSNAQSLSWTPKENQNSNAEFSSFKPHPDIAYIFKPASTKESIVA